MFRSEKGNTYINWVVSVLAVLIFSAIIIRVLVGERGIIQQKKEESVRQKSENNIVIELTNSTN